MKEVIGGIIVSTFYMMEQALGFSSLKREVNFSSGALGLGSAWSVFLT